MFVVKLYLNIYLYNKIFYEVFYIVILILAKLRRYNLNILKFNSIIHLWWGFYEKI